MTRVGILGIGTHLPPHVRGNEWWDDVVDTWRDLPRPAIAPQPYTPAMERVVAALRTAAADPFRGIRSRHVLTDGMTSTEMEALAAEAALARADVPAADIDLLLVHTAVPEHLLVNTACALHHRLGLPRACFSVQAEASAYSFVAQLALAEAMIVAGRARRALLVQSSAASRLIDRSDPVSVALGDAATAVVVGPVSDDRGVLAHVSRTDGRIADSLVAAVRGKRWYDDGAVTLHVHNAAGELQLFLETVDRCVEVVEHVLATADVPAASVDFFAAHQGTSWLRALAQQQSGLTHARTVDLFTHIGYVFAASLPLVLDAGVRDGSLRDGDLAMIFGGGTGITYGATLLRWGR